MFYHTKYKDRFDIRFLARNFILLINTFRFRSYEGEFVLFETVYGQLISLRIEILKIDKSIADFFPPIEPYRSLRR
jgi:hypothetical protein